VQAKNLSSDQGIRFQLRSLGLQDNSVVATPDVHGTLPWTQIEFPWVSGNDVQEMQVCIMRYPSDEDGNRIQGTVWVDDVALVPASAENSNP
jgi:hypothetical protein